MRLFHSAVLLTSFLAVVVSPARARADEKEVKAVLDKAIKALGGEEVLGKAKILSTKSTGTISFNGGDNPVKIHTTSEGLDRVRSEFEGEFGGNAIKGVTVFKGDKGWRKFGDDSTELDDQSIAREKRNVYMQLVSVLVLPLKGKDFKTESAADEKVGDKPASAIKVTGPDGKDFTLYFDKESGLPVRMVGKVIGFQGEEYTQDTTMSDYKEVGGIKKAMKSQSKRDGEKFIEMEITEFKVLDKADPDTFSEPK